MIVNALIAFLAFILDLTFRFVDTMGEALLPAGLEDFIVELFQMGLVFNELVPVTEIYLLLATVITFEMWVAGYKIALWIYEQLRHVLRS